MKATLTDQRPFLRRDFSFDGKEERMNQDDQIVFCFNPLYVTQEVVNLARTELPEGFRLTLIEKDIPRQEKLSLYEQADFLMLFSADPTPEEFEALKNVKLIQLLSAGYNKFDMKTANRMRIPVANNHGNSIAVAEFCLLLILALLKKLPIHNQTTRNGRWLEYRLMAELRELAGLTLGLVGMGHVGKEVAKRARSFDVSLLYYDIRRLSGEEEKDLGVEFVSLEELLGRSDIISLHVALTPQTKGLIGRKEFDLMKRRAILINTSRGEVVDQTELYRRLAGRRIAGAALDVFTPEPPCPDDPLFLLDNVIVTPHMAGATLDTWARRLRISYKNIQRIRNNQPAEFIVNPGFQ
jgi:phosphoglycerate dehydrogenase-like enzyme